MDLLEWRLYTRILLSFPNRLKMLKRKLTPLKMPSRKFSPNQKTVKRGKRRTRMATCQMM